MFKYILFLSCFYLLANQSTFAGGYIISGDDNPELHPIASKLAVSHGREAPEGWEIEENETKSYHQIVNNVTGLDPFEEISSTAVEQMLERNPNKNTLNIKKLPDEKIHCEFMRHDVEDTGVATIHYYYNKEIVLTRK